MPHLADKLGFATGTEEEADPQEAVGEAAAQVGEGGAVAARMAVEAAAAARVAVEAAAAARVAVEAAGAHS